jgi:hypothetical protein
MCDLTSYILAAEKSERFLDFERRLCRREYRDVKAVSRWQELVSALLTSLGCDQLEVDVALGFLQGPPVLARVFLRVLDELLLPQAVPGAKDTEQVWFLSIPGFWMAVDTIAFQ